MRRKGPVVRKKIRLQGEVMEVRARWKDGVTKIFLVVEDSQRWEYDAVWDIEERYGRDWKEHAKEMAKWAVCEFLQLLAMAVERRLSELQSQLEFHYRARYHRDISKDTFWFLFALTDIGRLATLLRVAETVISVRVAIHAPRVDYEKVADLLRKFAVDDENELDLIRCLQDGYQDGDCPYCGGQSRTVGFNIIDPTDGTEGTVPLRRCQDCGRAFWAL